MKRNLRRYGMPKETQQQRKNDKERGKDPSKGDDAAATNIFVTNGIKFAPSGDACVADVEQTSWLYLAALQWDNLLSNGCVQVKNSLLTSEPFLRTYCRRDHNTSALLSSWQQGDPSCGTKPVPSTALGALTASVLLGNHIFRIVPTKQTLSPSVRPTSSPGGNNNNNNNNGDGGGGPLGQNLEQVVIGLSFGAVLLVGVFCTVRYLKKQAHHRFARLEGGMIRNGADGRPPSDLGYGTYSQVTSNTFM